MKKLIPITKDNYKKATLELWKKIVSMGDVPRKKYQRCTGFKNKILNDLGYKSCKHGCPCCVVFCQNCKKCLIEKCLSRGYCHWSIRFWRDNISDSKLAKKFYDNIKPLLEEK